MPVLASLMHPTSPRASFSREVAHVLPSDVLDGGWSEKGLCAENSKMGRGGAAWAHGRRLDGGARGAELHDYQNTLGGVMVALNPAAATERSALAGRA